MTEERQLNGSLSRRIQSRTEGSELGTIPSDWQVRRIGELGQVVRGSSPRPAGDPRYFNGSFVPWLTVAALTNLPEDTLHVSETFGYLTEEGAKRSRLLPPGTLIISNSGATLGVAKILDIECCANDGIAAVLNQRTADAAFLCYYLNTQTNRLREVVATGNGQPNLNTGLIREISLPIPTPFEQRAIAEALSDVDGLLGALEALIAKKRAIKQAAMQQLLTGKTRLPGFSGEWETKRLEHVADCLDNVRIPLNESQRSNVPGPYPYCGANGVLDYVNDFVLDDDVILIAEDGGYFDEFSSRPIAYRMIGKIWVNNHAHILKAKSGVSQGFLYFSLVHKNILPYLASGTRAKLNKSEMNKIELLLPKAEKEQDTVAAILSDMDAEIAALEARRDKTRAIKQSMMQQLLTGRIRLVPPDPAAT